MRMARNARHTIDFDFNDVGRRVRNIDEYNTAATNNSNSNSSSQAQDEDASVVIRCDSPVIARLGPAVNCSNSNSSSGAGDALEVTLNNNNNSSSGSTNNSNLNRRRCGKTSVDLRPHHGQNQRFQLPPEQIDDCPSSGDEGVVSPRKRIKMDYHHHHHSNASGVSFHSAYPNFIAILMINLVFSPWIRPARHQQHLLAMAATRLIHCPTVMSYTIH